MRRLGLVSDLDLALHLPLRYEDETRLTPIGAARDGEMVQVEGTVREARVEQRARPQLVVRLHDGEHDLVLRFLHFYPSQRKALVEGARVRVRGEVRGGFFGREMVHPAFKVVGADTPLAQTLTPVYPTTAQLPQPYLRKAIASALARTRLEEVLPAHVLPASVPSLSDALRFLHHPPPSVSMDALVDPGHPAWQRLKFEELLAQQLAQQLAREEKASLRAPRLAPTAATAMATTDGPPVRPLRERLLATLPFQLTAAQQRVGREIGADMAGERPMHRLLQGDVGCGKTVVAALAAATAIDAGWQCALMAPTEILAEQHLRKLVQWLEPLGVRVAWLTGSKRGKARERMREQVASGEAALVVGTQAVIQEGVRFARLGLAVVDEQHRFGVAQRLALRRKLGSDAANFAGMPDPLGSHDEASAQPLEPHLLMMTATPIPRTLAMTYFADLDLSTIDELPPGRTPITTRIFADARRAEVIARTRDEVARGRQVYWVCPLIEEAADSDPLNTGDSVRSGRIRRRNDAPPLELSNAIDTHRELSGALPGRMVGLLHGRMPASQKAAVMSLFNDGTMNALVATTVIEVGVDVPNASLMVIEHAERFGLAQLHQLRGRIGRGSAASVCVLLYSAPLAAQAKARLRAMTQTQDGFEIARLDLQIRGPGEFMGTRQSGDALLRFADLEEDSALLQRARVAAGELMAHHREAALAHVRRWLRGRIDFVKA